MKQIYMKNMARSNTRNSRKWRDLKNFSTTLISPNEGHLRIRKVSIKGL